MNPPPPSPSPRKRGPGKRKIEIRKIEKKSSQKVCFSKRRQGIFKKAAELSILCDVQIAVLVFSPAGNLFSFGNPDADSVVRHYLGGPAPPPSSTPLQPQDCRLRRCSGAASGGDGWWWERINVEEMAEEEQLQKLLNELEETRRKVLASVEELSPLSARVESDRLGLPPPPPPPLGHSPAAMLQDSGLPPLGDAAAAAAIDVDFGWMMEEDGGLVSFSGAGYEGTIFDMFPPPPPPEDIHGNFFF